MRPTAPLRAAAAALAIALGLALGAAPAAGASIGPDLPARSDPSLARTAERSTINRDQLADELADLARQAPGASGFYVYDTGAKNKRVLFDRSEGNRRRLASNTKLFTTATAIDRLGPGSRLVTRVKRRGKVTGAGRLKGSLYLIGGGDPSLGSAGINELAREVRGSGVRSVAGRLFADDTVFDRLRGVADSNYGPSEYIAPLSGLVYGGSTYSADPAVEAAAELKDELKDKGVRISGKVRLGQLPGKLRKTPAQAEYLSPTIAALAAATNKPSNNFYAEMLLKGIAADTGKRGTTKRGTHIVEAFARRNGSGIDARDGSGLTANNRSSPRDVVRLLSAMLRKDKAGRAYYDSLAIAGQEGTLDDRMEGTAAAGRCRGKTGTISGVSALSGYCGSGRNAVAFSLLMNGVSSYDSARSIQDRMVVAIARYRR
jgi:D-alanyl-D-alanine carboxypeptidase/D-alanyl-D-alanine-endopeptidase (penicillin-binding protein 4)